MTCEFLHKFIESVQRTPGQVAFFNTRAESITYQELHGASEALAQVIRERTTPDKPVVIYGHKSPRFVVAIIAALKSGNGYAPVDIAYPEERVNDILVQLDHPLVIAPERPLVGDRSLAGAVIEADDCAAIVKDAEKLPLICDEHTWVDGDDLFYLLFTSGSTGHPKGVAMPTRSVDAFMEYLAEIFPQDGRQVSFNRVPFTFDMSAFDLTCALSSGSTLFALEEECDQNLRLMFEAFASSDATSWISTPSFADICLADPSFNATLLPKLRTMIFAGEPFHNLTAEKLLERFPEVRLYNMYGPTETQAVTTIEVTPDLVAAINPLPIGYVNPGIEALVVDPQTGREVALGATGEIYLSGATLASGYFGRPDLTAKAFVEFTDAQGVTRRTYKTGDKGYYDEQARLYCLGRYDFQVKINGARVELGEVEEALLALDAIDGAVVLPIERDGKVTSLAAHVVINTLAAADACGESPRTLEESVGRRQLTKTLKATLKTRLPEYMIPRKFVYHDAFPLNVNGKIDRKQLAAS